MVRWLLRSFLVLGAVTALPSSPLTLNGGVSQEAPAEAGACYAACAVQKSFDKLRADQQRSVVDAGCVGYLQSAKQVESHAMQVYASANRHGISDDERGRLIKQGNALIAQRSKLLTAYEICAGKALIPPRQVADPQRPEPILRTPTPPPGGDRNPTPAPPTQRPEPVLQTSTDPLPPTVGIRDPGRPPLKGPLNPPRPPGIQPVPPNVGTRCPTLDGWATSDQKRAQERAQIQQGCRWINGNYDLCANPNWYIYSQCVDPAKPLQGQATRNVDCTEALTPVARNELLAIANEMGRIASNVERDGFVASDRFFRYAAAAVEANLQFYAQPPGEPVRQTAQVVGSAVLAYLTNDSTANHDRLYNAASAEAARITGDPVGYVRSLAGPLFNDPARILGTLTGNVLFDGAGGGVGALCKAGVRNASKSALLKQAASRVVKIKQDARTFAKSALYRCKYPNASNPRLGTNACFEIALDKAEDYRGRLSAPLRGQPTATGADRAVTYERITEVLRERYPRFKVPNPNPFSIEQLDDILRGIPIPLDLDQIEMVLKMGGNGSQGLVFVDFLPTVSDPNPVSHVFNVIKKNGKVEFVDDTPGMRGQDALFTRSLMTNVRFFPIQWVKP